MSEEKGRDVARQFAVVLGALFQVALTTAAGAAI